MSIATEITRLQTAKADIKASIEAKGVTVPSNVLIDSYDDYVAQITGGGGGVVEKDVNFYDWEGTLLYSYTLAEAQALQALPALPTGPSGWTASSWTETLAYVNALTSPFNIGVNYTTQNDHYLEVDGVVGDEKTVGVYRNTYDGQVDWGDGTTGTISGSDGWNWHTYANSGSYTIKISMSVGNFTNDYHGYKETTVNGTKIKTEEIFPVAFMSETVGSSGSEKITTFVRKVRLGNKINIWLGGDTVEYILIPFGLASHRSFSTNSHLRFLTIPSSVTGIDTSTFPNSYFLQTIVIPSSVINMDTFSGCNSLKNITIPNSVTSIANSAFQSCSSLEKISIPSSVTTIGGTAFRYCSNLKNISIPNSVTSIGDQAFLECTSLQNISIPNLTTLGGWKTFTGCKSLKEASVPAGVENEFDSCTFLQKVTLGPNTTGISQKMFYFCRNLTDITIPSSVTSIAYQAFTACSSLQSITIPSSVTSIGEQAFSSCSWLYNVYVGATTPPTLSNVNAFTNTPIASGTGYIYVPIGCSGVYKAANNWSNYASQIKEPFEITNYKNLSLSTSESTVSWSTLSVPCTATLLCDGYDIVTGQTYTDFTLTDIVRVAIEPNTTSTSVTRTLSYTWPDSGLTATTTVTQTGMPSQYAMFTPESIATGWQIPNISYPGNAYRLPDGSGYTSYIKSPDSSASNSCYLDIALKGYTDFTFYIHCNAGEKCYYKVDSMVSDNNYDDYVNSSKGSTSIGASDITDTTQWVPVNLTGLTSGDVHHIYIFQAFSPTTSYGRYAAQVAVNDSYLS